MGTYINPSNETKESFLARVGVPLDDAPEWTEIPTGFAAVCLVRNPGFSAAGVADTPSELQRFVRGMHGRPHQWFLVRNSNLASVTRPLHTLAGADE